MLTLKRERRHFDDFDDFDKNVSTFFLSEVQKGNSNTTLIMVCTVRIVMVMKFSMLKGLSADEGGHLEEDLEDLPTTSTSSGSDGG